MSCSSKSMSCWPWQSQTKGACKWPWWRRSWKHGLGRWFSRENRARKQHDPSESEWWEEHRLWKGQSRRNRAKQPCQSKLGVFHNRTRPSCLCRTCRRMNDPLHFQRPMESLSVDLPLCCSSHSHVSSPYNYSSLSRLNTTQEQQC